MPQKIIQTQPEYFVSIQWGQGYHYLTHGFKLPLDEAIATILAEENKCKRKLKNNMRTPNPTIRLLKVVKEVKLERP